MPPSLSEVGLSTRDRCPSGARPDSDVDQDDVRNMQFDPVSRHGFSNVQTKGELANIDPVTDTIRIPLAGAGRPVPRIAEPVH